MNLERKDMEQLLTPEAAAEKLAVSVKTVKNLLRSGKLRGVKVGNLWRVQEKALEEYLEEPSQKLQKKTKMERRSSKEMKERGFETSLAKRLWEIRLRIVASGQPLLSRDEIEREIAERRGETE